MYIVICVGDGTKASMRLLLRRSQLSWKSRNGFWKFHKAKFCVPVLFGVDEGSKSAVLPSQVCFAIV